MPQYVASRQPWVEDTAAPLADLRREHTARAQRIHAVFFHLGGPALGEGALRSEQGLAALQEAMVRCLSPAGQQQVATALEVTAALEERMHALQHRLLDAGYAPASLMDDADRGLRRVLGL